MIIPITLSCPYCGESFETSADTSAGSTEYIEDCAICCKPIEVHLEVEDDELLDVRTRSDSD